MLSTIQTQRQMLVAAKISRKLLENCYLLKRIGEINNKSKDKCTVLHKEGRQMEKHESGKS